MLDKLKFRLYNYFHHIGKGVERFLRSLCRFFYGKMQFQKEVIIDVFNYGL